MEGSSLSTVSIVYPSSPSTESLLLKRVGFPLRYQILAPVSLNKSASQSLVRQLGPLVHKENSIKVLCSLKNDIPTLEVSCMDEVCDALAERIVPTLAAASNPNLKHIVCLAGPSGAGKSTIASEVVRLINKLWPQRASSFDSEVMLPEVAAVLPMDGFHLYCSQLAAMENPEEAHARRGAPWTFAPTLLLECPIKLRNEGSVYAPSFDHGVGDPVEDDIFVSLQFIDVVIETAMNLVLKRRISTGKPPDVTKWQVDYNDRPNAELVINSKKYADSIIKSINF